MDTYFEHASVGSNITGGLASLASTDAFRYTIERESIGSDSTTLTASVAQWFTDNNGFLDNGRDNPDFTAKAARFDTRMRTAGFAATVDVAFFKYCYIDNNYLDTYADAEAAFAYVRGIMEGLETAYPNVTFVWWTMPLTTGGSAETDAYNELVRAYCSSTNRYLFDIADIECHDELGVKAVSGSGREALVSAYASDNGHLNGAGSERVARALWVLLARVSGW